MGRWSTDEAEGLTQIDLATGHQLLETDSAELGCADSPVAAESACPLYDESTMVEALVYGVKSAPAPASGVVAELGIFRFDPATGTEELVTAWPWDNGVWYPEDLFPLDGLIVMSVVTGMDNRYQRLSSTPHRARPGRCPKRRSSAQFPATEPADFVVAPIHAMTSLHLRWPGWHDGGMSNRRPARAHGMRRSRLAIRPNADVNAGGLIE